MLDNNKVRVLEIDGIKLVELISNENLNALDLNMLKNIGETLDEIEKSCESNIVIITGTGKAFIAGADIAYMKDLDPKGAIEYSRITTSICAKIEKSKKIYIAAINGFALGGGCELCLSCDLRIASSKAKFGLPETSLGIIPGAGGTQKLSRLVGRMKAKELIFTGDIISADVAFSIGLVNSVVETDQLIEKALELARKIRKNSSNAVELAKEAIDRGSEMDIDSALYFERILFGLCFSSKDQKEGMLAFIEKRKPIF